MIRFKFEVIWAIFLSSVLLMVSCCQQEESFFQKDNLLSLTCIRHTWKETRAITSDGGEGTFSEGDRIELLVTGEKKTIINQLEYTNGQWTPHLQRNELGTGGASLSALFPVLPQGDNDLIRKFSVPINQSCENDYMAADILFASTTLNIADVLATLQFKHALHRININLEGFVPDDLMVEVKSLSSGQISLKDGNIIVDKSTGYEWLKPYRKNANTYSVIVIPQSIEIFNSGEGLIRLTSKGQSSFYKFSANIQGFNAGMQTTINLTLKDGDGSDTNIEFANQTYWVYGVNSPNFPGKENIPSKSAWEKDFEDGLWFRYSYDNFNPPKHDENQYLTWKEGCGWYDCNKTFGYKGGDGKMCWAAGASNLIHWWMENNRKYIEAYDKKYASPYIPRPEKYTKMTEQNQEHSEVFSFFKKVFGNKGSWDTGGVNWFINGDSKNIYPTNIKNFSGFFSEVFKKTDKIAVEIKNPSKENFNIWMKDAFKNNRAIGFSSYDFAGKGTGVHAMTIWGAEFDAEGNVEYVYFCDNNLSENEPNHASLRRFKVVYGKSTIPEIKEPVAYLRPLDYNDGTIPKAYPFSSLTLVDLRIDLWQNAFPDIK